MCLPCSSGSSSRQPARSSSKSDICSARSCQAAGCSKPCNDTGAKPCREIRHAAPDYACHAARWMSRCHEALCQQSGYRHLDPGPCNWHCTVSQRVSEIGSECCCTHWAELQVCCCLPLAKVPVRVIEGDGLPLRLLLALGNVDVDVEVASAWHQAVSCRKGSNCMALQVVL